MDCPSCKRPMIAGKIESRGVSRSIRDGTFFVGADGKENEIGKYTKNDALQCDDCGTLLIKGRFAD